MADYKKIGENTIRSTETTPEVITPAAVKDVDYNYDFLIEQRKQIQKDYDRDAATLALRQAELDKVNELITECEKLGITSAEVKPEPIEP